MTVTPEVWKPVPGHEGFYEASNLGRIRSLDRIEPHHRHDGFTQIRCGRILKISPSGDYWTVRLRGKTRMVHTVILETFVGPKPPGLCACHGPDFDTSNNALSNLRWDTYSANNLERRAPVEGWNAH